jgi:amino acid adenylation domain-containing protein
MSVAPHGGDLSAPEKRQLLERLLREKAALPKQYPLSFGQERLWFMDRLQPGMSVYNLGTSIPFAGSVDAACLQACVSETVQRHEVLRTHFGLVAGQPVQIVAPRLEVPLAVVDLNAMPASTRWSEATRLVTREAQTPFNLAQGPLVRFGLLRLDADTALLLLTMHHIISDAWSLGVLMRELAVLYEAYATGCRSPLPPLPMQYGDYARWQRQWLQGPVLQRHLSYWARQLAGLPALSELPSDRPRPAIQSFRGALRSFHIDAGTCKRLRALGRRAGATLYMILLAAFQVLMLRYGGQADGVVGTPIANRTQGQHEALIGLFANMLVIRTDLTGNPIFLGLLGRVREVTLEAYAHQDLPFERLVEELQPSRHLGHHPLFQVMFAYQNVPTLANPPPAGEGEVSEVMLGTTRFDLSLFMEDSGAGLRGTFEYSTDLFDHDRIYRMIGHFRTLLEAIAADPERRLWDLPLLSAGEQRLLSEWNATTAAFPDNSVLPRLFEKQVEAHPDAVAAAVGEVGCTYREMNRRANQLAHHLRDLGVGPETCVGICVERSIEMVIGLLAILKAGAAYLPLDPGYPAERLEFMLSDAQVPVVLTDEHTPAALSLRSMEVVRLDADWPILARQPTDNPAVAIDPDSLAYVIYTSGSTGLPKGVQVPHAALANLLNAMARELQPTSDDRLLAVTTLSFDIAALELFLPLTVGARVVIARRQALLDGPSLADSLVQSGVTMMQATPVTWRLLTEAGWQGDGRLKILSGGEALTQDLTDRLLERGGPCWNLYGPTEATIYATVGRLGERGEPVSIGRPIANTQAYLLDQNLNPVPIGVAADLYLGGAGVARGYLNRPEMTAEKFVPDPFGPNPGGRLYRTGDCARYGADGTIEFLGRSDFQVKIRGFRIEPGEVESVLEQHPLVRQAVVVAREDGPVSGASGKYLAAYIAAREDRPPTSALYEFLRAKLPDYLLPAALVWLDRFPVTPNGKVDRSALPPPGSACPAVDDDFVAPRNPVEQVVSAVWADILGIERVGVHDNFFALGGHSLLATRVMYRLSDVFQSDLPLLLLFKASTVAALSRELLNHPVCGSNLEAAAELLLQVSDMSDAEAGLIIGPVEEPAR